MNLLMTGPSPLSICCFGGLQFIVAGTAVTGFASRKADALFVYLACNPRAHPRETLAALLWPNNNQTRALANLSVALTSLRKQLDNYLVIERHTIGFNSEANSWLDTAVFQHAINQAKEQKQRKGKLSRTGAAQLDTAVSLYKGDFLAGFNIRNAPEFEAWTLLAQERLRQMMITSLADLIAFYQQRGQVSQGIRYAQQLLALDSLQEEAHRDLMRLYVQNNQRPAALAQYEQCATTLANELGVEPDEETTTLYNQIRDKQATWTPEDLNTPAAKHSFPSAITSFIGREAELAQIDQWLAEPNGRLLTITGPGGMGKTRLAQEAARAQVGNFADGVWHVSLVPLADDGELVTAVAEVIGLVFAGTLDPARQLVSYLVEKEMLLVLDNFEHLVTESSLALLTEILQRTVELKLLVTSRERLNLQAEALLNLRGLPFPVSSKQHSINSEHSPSSNPSAASDQIFHSPISYYPAVQLFSNRTQRLQVDFELDGVATAVAKLCQLVEGLPLALELAATWIRTLTVPEIVTEIERGIDFLATTWRDMPERHRSVRAVCATSWQMLSPVEQDVYSRLSVCRGGFSREAAWQIANASLATLNSLADKSFLRLDGAAGQQVARYRRHPLLIQFAAEQLAQQPKKLAESQQRLAAYLAQALADRADHFYSPKRTAVMVFMTAEHENIRLAWQWALANAPSLLASMAASYQQYLIGTGLFAEGAKQFSLAVSALNQPDQALERARLLIPYCQFARLVGQTEVGRDAVLESLAILDRTSQTENTSAIESLALRQYGSLLLSDDNKYAEAKKVHEQALTIFRKQNSWVGQGTYCSTSVSMLIIQVTLLRLCAWRKHPRRCSSRRAIRLVRLLPSKFWGLSSHRWANLTRRLIYFIPVLLWPLQPTTRWIYPGIMPI